MKTTKFMYIPLIIAFLLNAFSGCSLKIESDTASPSATEILEKAITTSEAEEQTSISNENDNTIDDTYIANDSKVFENEYVEFTMIGSEQDENNQLIISIKVKNVSDIELVAAFLSQKV